MAGKKKTKTLDGMYYVGIAFLPGIPARDLTEEEVMKFGRNKLLKSKLYVNKFAEVFEEEL